MSIGKVSAAYVEQRRAKQQKIKAEVARLYEDGRTLQQVAKECRLRVHQVIDILENGGVERRQTRILRINADASGLLTEATRLYQAGHTLHRVGEALSISPSAVHALLKLGGVPRRPAGPPPPVPQVPTHRVSDVDIIELYQAGHTLQAVSDSLLIAVSTVLAVLKRGQVPRRPKGRPKSVAAAPSARNIEIAETYRAGETLAATGAKFGITRERVRQILVAVGVTERHAQGGPPLPNELRDEAVRRYVSGATINSVAHALDVCHATVRHILIDRGIARRGPGRQKEKQRPLVRRRQQAMARLYRSGRTCVQVARAFHTTPMNVWKILVRLGVERRGRGSRSV